MVFWKRYIKKLKEIISRKEFDALKKDVDTKATKGDISNLQEQINECAKLSSDNQFHGTNYFNGTTHFEIANASNMILEHGSISNNPVDANDLVNKAYVDSKSSGGLITIDLKQHVPIQTWMITDKSFIVTLQNLTQNLEELTFLGIKSKLKNGGEMVFGNSGYVFVEGGSAAVNIFNFGLTYVLPNIWCFCGFTFADDDNNKSLDLNNYEYFHLMFSK